MVLTARKAAQHIEHVLGGALGSTIPPLDVVNQAASVMENSRKWAYLLRSTQALNFRGPQSGTIGIFTTVDKTLVDPALTTYDFVPGDTITASLLGAELGTYDVVSQDKTAGKIVLDATNLTTDAAPIVYTMNQARILLPSDFGRLVSLHGASNGTFREVYPDSLSGILEEEEYFNANTRFTTGYHVEWNSGPDKAQPVATLRLTPEPSAGEFDALSAVYYRVWTEATSDADVLPLPQYMEAVFLQYCRALALGYDASVSSTAAMSAAIDAVEVGPIYRSAARRDSSQQLDTGPARNRGIEAASTGISLTDALGRSQASGSFF